MPNPLYTYILNAYDLVSFGLFSWYINHCRLFNAKSSYTYILYPYDSVWFEGIAAIVVYLMPNQVLYT